MKGLAKASRVATICFLSLCAGWGRSGDTSLDLTKLSDDDLKTVTVHFERKGCYGSCPAYTITIHGDGRVEYLGKGHVKAMDAQSGRMEPQALRTLLAEFAKADFSSLPENYTEGHCNGRICTDMATVVTQLEVKGASHTVNHYYGCGGAPKALFELESLIDKTANSEQWTGDVSKQGPFGTTCFG